jgi:DNA-binding GntR family transcriptional regulator
VSKTKIAGSIEASVGRADVVEYLRRQIYSRELLPGQPIRQELVAKTMGASRLPVREALRTLEGEGLVRIEPNRGARVTAMDEDELYILYEARAKLEPLVIAESVKHLTEAQIAKLGETLDKLEQVTSGAEFLVMDREFHRQSYVGCPSEQLLSIVRRLWNTTQQYRRAFVRLGYDNAESETKAEHRLIFGAVQSRSPEVAAQLVGAHIMRTKTALQRHAGKLQDLSFGDDSLDL